MGVVAWSMFTVSAAAQALTSVAPTFIPVSGELRTPDGQPRTGNVLLIISLYEAKDDPAPRWIEHQVVTLDAAGRYSVQFGGTREDGLPADLFTGVPGMRWLGVAVEGEVEGPRVGLVSVPYAVKAASADALGGKTANEYVLNSALSDGVRAVLQDEGMVGAAAIDGTLGYLQKGDGAGGTTDANMFESVGNIGIGTIAPRGRLDVNGPFYSSSIDTGSVNATSLTSLGAVRWANNVAMAARNASNTAYIPILKVNTLNNVEIGQGAGSGSNVAIFGDSQVTLAAGGYQQMTLGANGASFGVNVGIGTVNPQAKLHIVGDVRVDGNIGAKYQDVAEWVPAVEPLEDGSVVVIDLLSTNKVRASVTSYSTSVIGAVSAQPGLILGEPGDDKVLVAQSGRVKVKADATFGAIRPGDLLVTSPTKGHVMRSRPVKAGEVLVHRPGTLVGKALEGLPTGRGEILVLLTLQ
jgi:hypothetical protein